jgi:hypothetical protein
MDEETKKKCIEYLQGNPLFQKTLSKITNKEEQEKALALAEDVFVQLLEGLSVMKKVSEEHPDKMAEVAKSRINKK